MKKVISISLLIIIALKTQAQANNDTIPLKDLIVPSTPAFNLLDISPKTVERPATVKALALSVISTTEQNSGIPKNFAFEFAPFWLIKHPNMSFFKYNGIKIADTFHYKPNIFYGFQNTSIAIASTAKDSSKSFNYNVNYISYSVRTNILNLRKRKVIDTLYTLGRELNQLIIDVLKQDNAECDSLLNAGNMQAYLKCQNDMIFKKDTMTRSRLQLKRDYIDTILTIRPVFTLDFAFASSTAFGNNQFSNSHGYRTGWWLNLGYSQPLLSSDSRKTLAGLFNAKNYINIYGFFRMLAEDSTVDFKNFTRYTYVDYGGRLEFEFNHFAISFESIHRSVGNHSELNTFRNVGILQYRVNDNLFLTGSFGKNFGSQNNLVAFLGINFGFGKTSLYNKFQ
ncbi:MAG TPA: hypothetical protein VFW07_17675 [Parafilimonas sp.]|nr:hypothetical protein [Parafilimonas sp.]